MKFKAAFTDRGIRTLGKAFLPTLDKFGKSCQLLLGSEEVHFVQTQVDTDGPYLTARFAVGVLFNEQSYVVKSKHYNLIAFSVDISMLLKVLSSAGVNDADVLEVKLTQKPVKVPESDEPENRPFLSFQARGQSLNLIQDLPVSRPYVPSDIDRLVRAKEVATLCSYYLDLAAAGPRLQSVLERMKALSSVLTFTLAKNGDVHIQVSATNVMLGTQLQGLSVFPPTVTCQEGLVNRDTSAEDQLQAALNAEEALQVQLQLKHLVKVLSASQLTQPSQVLCGIADNSGHVHIMYVYKDPSADAPFDDSLALTYKLPVRLDD